MVRTFEGGCHLKVGTTTDDLLGETDRHCRLSIQWWDVSSDYQSEPEDVVIAYHMVSISWSHWKVEGKRGTHIHSTLTCRAERKNLPVAREQVLYGNSSTLHTTY